MEAEQLGQDNQARTDKQESQDRTVSTGQPGQERTARTGYSEQDSLRSQPVQFGLTGQPEQGSLERTDGTSQHGQVSLAG